MMLNDSYKNPKVVSTSPINLACACLYCAIEISTASNNVELPVSRDALEARWWKLFDVDDDNLVLTCDWVIESWESIVQEGQSSGPTRDV